ncbi:protein ECERIFERUM 2 [Nicotiana tabacum]|uniref:Protein ECERIFERUM 1 n=1 Tax=Nicotiana tabacum TaxID=4097 RepID=A0A1S3Y527_TOBAC|nr:PREDICTED: protein ECERIFERUM 1 [Nicotiana tabacum]
MDVEKLISDIKSSSVVPAKITGADKVHEFTNMDLVMKLHYIKGLYFFSSDAVEDLNIYDFKKPMFHFLELYYETSGRIRRSEDGGGRPFIKCNDGGVRIIEAKSSKTIEEWLVMNDSSVNDQLVYDQVLGPELGFAPLVFIQFTWFKCGGMSIGLSWAHVLGDVFSASNFINIWAQIMGGQLPPQSLNNSRTNNKFINPLLSTVDKLPFSLKKVDPVGDHWRITNSCKMISHSFHITEKELNQHISKIFGPKQSAKVKPFDVISATMWKILAKVRGESAEPGIVTIISKDNSCDREITQVSNNGQMISIVEANNVKVSEANVLELAKLIAEKGVDETKVVEELMEKENGTLDFVVYGANLTFVNLEKANIYGFELRGKKPLFASYNISEVGEEGVVLVLAGPENLNGKEGGRIVNLVLPEDQIERFKNELREELGVF